MNSLPRIHSVVLQVSCHTRATLKTRVGTHHVGLSHFPHEHLLNLHETIVFSWFESESWDPDEKPGQVVQDHPYGWWYGQYSRNPELSW